MNRDHVEGAVQDVAGKIQQTVGMGTGSGSIRARGVARELTGKGQYAYGELRDTGERLSEQAADFYERTSAELSERTQDAKEKLREYPFTSLLVAGTVGFLVGLLVHGRREL